MPYWYNITTGSVESDENRSANDQVMGPYDTHEEAAAALTTAAARTEKWDEEDKEWEDWGAGSSGGGSWSDEDGND